MLRDVSVNCGGVATELGRQGFVGRPECYSLRMGVRPQGIFQAEPGGWPHGWQYYASSSSEHIFRKNVVLDHSCAADQAHLRSHSGPGASDALSVCPSKPEFRIEAGLFRTLILERLGHRAARNLSGRLKTRALLHDMNLADFRCFSELSWLWTSQSAAPLLREGTARDGQGRRSRVHRSSGGQGTDVLQNSSVATGVVWSLSLSKREEDVVSSLWKVWPQQGPVTLHPHSAALAWR